MLTRFRGVEDPVSGLVKELASFRYRERSGVYHSLDSLSPEPQQPRPRARAGARVRVRSHFSRAPPGGARGCGGAARTRGEPDQGAEGEERRGGAGGGAACSRCLPGAGPPSPPGSGLAAGGGRGGGSGAGGPRAAGAWLQLRVLGNKMAAALRRPVPTSSPVSSAPPLASSSSSISSSCSSPSDRRSAGRLSRSSGGG